MGEYGSFKTDNLGDISQSLASVRELLLANVVMFGEIPAPTFEESARARFLLDRFIEAGCQSVSTDAVGNAVAIHPGKTGRSNILVSAHLDTVFPATADHTVNVQTAHMTGAGIMDNSLGVAVVASLPMLLEAAGIELEDNLILLGTTRSHGDGDIEGMRYFLDNNHLPLRAGILCEGGTLGRLSHEALGMMRGLIEVTLPPIDPQTGGASALASASEHIVVGEDGQPERAWPQAADGGRDYGAIPVLNRILSGILALEVPREPPTQIILGSVEAGVSYNTRARSAVLRFELRSEGKGVVSDIALRVRQVVESVAAHYACPIEFRQVARRHRTYQPADSFCVELGHHVLGALGVAVRAAPSTGEIEALLARDIPALTIGLTRGGNRHARNETIEIEPLFTGLTQLLALLQGLDNQDGAQALGNHQSSQTSGNQAAVQGSQSAESSQGQGNQVATQGSQSREDLQTSGNQGGAE